MHLEGDDAVREVRLLGRCGPGGAEWLLGDQDRQRLQVAQPLEEEVQLGPTILHLGHRLEDVERVDDEDRDGLGLHHAVTVHLEKLEPGAAALQVVEVLPDVPHVKGRDVLRGARVRHPEGRHVLEGQVLALLQREVGGLAVFLEGVLVQEGVGEGGFHRSRRSVQEDHEAFRDPSAEEVVQASHVRLDPFSVRGQPSRGRMKVGRGLSLSLPLSDRIIFK